MSAVLPMSTPPTVFDGAWADQLVAAAVMAADNLGGCKWMTAIAWLKDRRPEVVVFLGEASRAVDTAVLGADAPGVVKACERFIEAHRRAFAIYTDGQQKGEETANDQLTLLAS